MINMPQIIDLIMFVLPVNNGAAKAKEKPNALIKKHHSSCKIINNIIPIGKAIIPKMNNNLVMNGVSFQGIDS